MFLNIQTHEMFGSKLQKTEENIDLFLGSTPTHSTALTSCSEYTDDIKIEERPNFLEIEYPAFWQENLFVNSNENLPSYRQRSRTADDLVVNMRPELVYSYSWPPQQPFSSLPQRQRALTSEGIIYSSYDRESEETSINSSNQVDSKGDRTDKKVCLGGSKCLDANTEFFREIELESLREYRSYFSNESLLEVTNEHREKSEVVDSLISSRIESMKLKPVKELNFLKQLAANQEALAERLFFGSKLLELRKLGQKSKFIKLEKDYGSHKGEEIKREACCCKTEGKSICRSCKLIGCKGKKKRISKKK